MIAIVVAERTAEAVRAAFARLVDAPQDSLIEVRLDVMDRIEPEVCGSAPRRVIATCRRASERGAYSGSEADRSALLQRALAAGAAFIDAELEVRPGWDWLPPARTIVSVHDYEGRGEEASAAAVRMLGGSAAYAKLALRGLNLSDLNHLRALAQVAPGRLIVVGLGPAGVVTRALSDRVGAPWTYVRAPSDEPCPPGLAALPSIDDFARWGLLGAPPKFALGVLSDRASDSIGPWMFNHLFQKHALPATYLPISTPDATELKSFLSTWGLHGLSITIPFKRAALAAADEVTPLAQRVGAANTLYCDRGRWVADNTDVIALRDGLLWSGGNQLEGPALVVGGGGAARAALAALESLKLPARVYTRRSEQAQALAQEFRVETGPLPSAPPKILINATPVGSARAPNALPVPSELVTRDQLVYDVTYAAQPSPLIRLARERGARVLTGADMYAIQAKEQFERWFPDHPLSAREFLEATTYALARKFQ